MTALEEDRRRSTVDINAIAAELYGGEEAARRRLFVLELAAASPVLAHEDRLYGSRQQQYERSLAKDAEVLRLVHDHDLDEHEAALLREATCQQLCMNGLHYIMFVPTLKSQATEKQQRMWLGPAERHEIIGTYAQTELGHGSFVRGIETTATYDPATEEFILHSPTLTSTKWWPGSLGKTSTHCITVARLIVGGVDHGVHQFFTPLRSMEDHSSLPGVELGDIGPKFDYNTMDNGYMRFTHYRLPRNHLLARFAQVTKEGLYIKPKHAKTSYLPLVESRSKLVHRSGAFLSKAVTIAVRYSLVRRQGNRRQTIGSKQEDLVLDYQLQQYRLIPLVAKAFAFLFAGERFLKSFQGAMADIKRQDFSQLAEMHALAAGLKAFATWEAAEGIEECRRACGGHGYLAASHLPELVARFVPNCTFEGDNYVLVQQTARYLLKWCRLSGKEAPGTVAHLAHGPHRLPTDIRWSSYAHLELLLEHSAAYLAHTLKRSIELHSVQLGSEDAAWDHLQCETVAVTRAHCDLFFVRQFKHAANAASPTARSPLMKLASVFALQRVEAGAVDLLASKAIDGDQLQLLRAELRRAVSSIRPDALSFVDAFQFTDHALGGSVLGRSDGAVYEALAASAAREPLNSQDVTPGYVASIRPVLRREIYARSSKL